MLVALVVVSIAGSSNARPSETGPPRPVADVARRSEPVNPAPVTLRVAVSPGADERLSGIRLRRLLSIEIDELAQVDSAPTGSLDGDLIRVWVDVPTPRRALIEVRRDGRRLARRTLAIGGFPADVAARVVAIEAAEMVRVQARPVTPRPVTPPPTDGAETTRASGGLAVDGYLDTLFVLSGEPVAFLGPSLALSNRQPFAERFFTAQVLYARWSTSLDGAPIRWLEVGAAFDFRYAPSEDWRLRAGVAAGAVALGFPKGTQLFAEPADEALTLRATGMLGAERRLSSSLWLGLRLEPGAMIREARYVIPSEGRGELSGFVLGVAVGLSVMP